MKKKMKKSLILLLSLLMVLTMMPMGVWAEGDGTGETDPAPAVKVAKIGETEYKTLDEAVAAAEDGATIELLRDCTTEGMNLSKDITIEAAENPERKPVITFTKYGIALWGKALTFKNCDVVMNDIGSTPYTAEWNWMTICASTNASLSLDNVNMTMDGKNAGNKHAIYFCSNNKLNLSNGSVLTIQNYQQDALEWDGGDGGYNVNITDSTFISNNNRSGFTGTFYATIDNGIVKVTNSLGNGSNGTYYTIKNNSDVVFDGNRNWGISAWRIDMTNNSTLTATNNGYSGIWTRVLNVDSTCKLDVEGNGNNAGGFEKNAGVFFQGNGTYESTIEEGANVTIKNNAGSGIYTAQKVCNLTILSGTIMNNGTGTINVQNQKGATYGGGVYNVGTMYLDTDVVIYNNHADTAGDDIYNANTGTITFGNVGSDWALDGAPDCTHAIDGWYHDGFYEGETALRWKAHGSKPYYTELFDDFSEGSATVTGQLALKAAHGLMPVDPEDPDTADWTTSKSKTATNLKKQSDGTYTSDVTLSLPSSQENLVSDVVFVLDESSCSDPVKEKVGEMLESLYQQVRNTDASIKIGAVQFRGEVTEFSLTELSDDTETDISNFMSARPETGGSNMSAGLIAGKKMLDEDTDVDDSRKYLILVSDGITYIWDDETTETQENYGVNFANGDTPNTPMLAGPDGWDVKHGNGYVPGNWSSELASIDALLSSTITDRASSYVRGSDISDKPFVAYSEKDQYASTVDIALYKSDQIYKEIASKYHAYAVCEGVEREMETYPFGPSFMSYLADDKEVSFDTIEKEIYYLLSAGSKITDVIGHTDDYNFDFVNNADKLILTVDGIKQSVTDLTNPGSLYETACYGFGEASDKIDGGHPYVLHYYANGTDGKSDECFVWDINVPVTNFARVQLTYTVKLTNPQTASGTYGEYDRDGSHKKASLYTNNSATLYPIDSNGEQGLPELFNKPTVSYTVSSGGGGGGGSTTTPTLNKEDHYAYIIGYPEDYRTGEATDDKSLWPVKPENSITRAEVATIFFRMLTDDSRSEYWMQTNPYSDVKASLWYNNAISTLTNGKIINGYEDGTFQPNAPITRAEFAAMAARFSDVEYSGSNGFSDVSDSYWAAKYIALAEHLGWINGYPDGTFKPSQPITRAEAMKLVNEVLDRTPDKDKMLDSMIKWPDNDENAWYYAHVQEATNSHEYEERKPATNPEKWTSILEVRAWADLEREWSNANSSKNPGEVVKKS